MLTDNQFWSLETDELKLGQNNDQNYDRTQLAARHLVVNFIN